LANPQDDGTAAAQAAIAQKQAEKLDAEVKLLSAKRDEAVARATNTNVQAMFGATNAGNLIAQTPAIAPLADELMLSAGFEDKNQPPVIPSIAAPIETDPALMVPQNTSPNFPPQADRGFTQGIEGGQ
jgi:hypothetical protein